MNFNLVFLGAFILTIFIGLYLNARADKRRSIFEDDGVEHEISNTMI